MHMAQPKMLFASPAPILLLPLFSTHAAITGLASGADDADFDDACLSMADRESAIFRVGAIILTRYFFTASILIIRHMP